MSEAPPRRLRGHKATATCCIASHDRPGLVATSGEVISPTSIFSTSKVILLAEKVQRLSSRLYFWPLRPLSLNSVNN